VTGEVSPVTRSGHGLVLCPGGQDLPLLGRLELLLDDRVRPEGIDPRLDVWVVQARLGVGNMQARVHSIPDQSSAVGAPVLPDPEGAHLVLAKPVHIGKAKVDEPPVRPQVPRLLTAPRSVGGLHIGALGFAKK